MFYIFCECTNLKNVSLPNQLQSIEERAFGNCNSITNIVIPSSCTIIGSSAFQNCIGLKTIDLPLNLKLIHPYAFSGCKLLESITIPQNTRQIYKAAFNGCENLKTIIIKNDNLREISDNAFYKCNSLREVHITNINNWWNTEFKNSQSNPLSNAHRLFVNEEELTSLIIPDGVKEIKSWAFYGGSNISNITIPSSVVTVGRDAFTGTQWYNNQPEGVIYIGNVANKYKGKMPNNTTIHIHDGTVSISEWAFGNCSGLVSVIIPNSVMSIGANGFYECDNLSSIINYRREPISINSDVFSVYSTATLSVPVGSKSKYEATPAWNQFKTIVEFGDDDSDKEAPKLIMVTPETGSSDIPITGEIVFTFDEPVKMQEGAKGKLNGIEIEPVVNDKTIRFKYSGLEYKKNYTLLIPANSVMDLAGNMIDKDITLTFTTADHPTNAILHYGQFSHQPWIAKSYEGEGNPPSEWYKTDFDDSSWGVVTGPLSSNHALEYYNTYFPPTHKHFWLRRYFNLNEIDGQHQYVLFVTHDDDCVVYLNGVEVFNEKGWHVVPNYSTVTIDPSLLRTGRNVVAVDVQDVYNGEAFIDFGLYTDAEVAAEEKGELALDLSPKRIEENANQPVKLKLTRTGSWAQEETFILTATTDSRVTVPATITIPAKQSAAVINLPIKNNDVLDADSIVEITATGEGYETVRAQLIIEDDDYPALTVKSSKSIVSEGETFQLTISTSEAVREPLIVTLTCENPKRFTCPMQATIPAGQKSVTVDVTAKDDDVPSETLSNAFVVSAPRYESGEAIVLLEDDDMPILDLTILPNKVQEGAGPVSVAGILRRTGVTNNKITVRLSDDSNGGLYFGTRELVLNKDVEEVNFNFGPIDNSQVDGNRTYTITAAVWLSSCSCSAAGESAGSVSASLEVLDDDGPALTLASTMSTIKEGGKAVLTVGRNTLVSLDQPLTVHLSSDYDSNLSYDHTVTIPAGQQSIQVEITSKKNDISGDTHTVVFTVQADGFASGTCYMMVTDQTLPDAVITSISVAESEVEAGGMATISMTVMNGGQDVLPSQTRINIYVDGSTEVLRTLYTQEELNPGESTTISRQVKINIAPGDKRLYAIVNEEKQVAELSYNNNTSLPIDVHVLSPYRITIQSDKSRYLPGDTVLLSGSVTGSLSANSEIEVYVINDGLRQTMTITTDNEGKFKAYFTPYERQIGHFVVGACYPGEGLAEELTGFDVIGLRRTTQEYITCEVLIGTPYQGVISIENLGRIAQSNIRVELLTTNGNCVAHFEKIDKIGPNERTNLSYSLEASSPSSGSDWELLKARVISDEGATTDIIIYYYCISPSAHLVANVDEFNTTISIGAVKEYPLTITNKGAGETGNISLALPSYITSQSVMNIPSLKQDESVTIILKINTMDGMQVNVPISGSLGINCENANGLCVPYTIVPVSESKGKLVIDVCDEYTYYTPLAPHVANANVKVCRPITNEVICEGITDNNGLYEVELLEGYYQVTVNAEKHESYQNYVLVDAGKENISIVNLSYDGGIKVSWDVVETEVEDEYQIHTTISYETNVPTPVLILDMPESIPANELRVGESLLFNAILTNKGMIAIHEAQLILPSGLETLTFENIGSGPVTLSPQQSVVFPIKVTRIAPSNSPRRGQNAAGEIESDIPCTEVVIPIGYWNCGVDKKWYWHEGVTLNLGRLCPPSDLKGDGGGNRSELPLFGRLSGANFNPYIPNIPTLFPEIHHNIKDCQPCLQSQLLTIVDCGLSSVSKTYKVLKGIISCLSSTYDAMKTIFDGRNDKQKKMGAIIEASAVCGSALSSQKGGSRLSEAITSILYKFDETVGRLMQGKEMDWDYTVDVLGVLVDDLAKLAEFGFEGFKEIACPLKLLKPCEDGRKTTRAQSFDSKMGETLFLPLMVQTNDPSYIQEYKRSISYGVVEMLAMIGIKKELFGDDEWFLTDADELTAFYMTFNSLLNMDGSFPISNMKELLGSKPDNLNTAQIESFIQRWNNSLSEDGIENRVNIEKAMSYFELINEVQKQVNSLGYPSVAECAEEASSRLMDYMEKTGDNVCASITLEINQALTLTRPAYRGTLTVFNGHDSAAMTDARLNLVVRDENGKVATAHEFQINAESLEGFGGEVSLTSGWTLEAQQTGKATILFIPTKYAAPTEPVKYSFGGTLTYIDPFTGLEVTRDLFPVTLTVNPSPDLELTYLMQRDVYGDDPLTEDVIEPKEPAEFALIINNKGNGEAKKVRLLTEQPKIVDNEKGLLIDFQLVSSQVNGEPATLSFGKTIANNFGTIPAHSQAYGQWWLESSLLGHFTSYEVEATHVTSYGNQNLSLIDTVTIHEMIHGFTDATLLSSKPRRGYLVNDIVDADDLPDVVYFTDATQQPLYISTGNIDRLGNSEYMLTATTKQQGWNYGSVADPTGGKLKLASITRSRDGAELPIDNMWQTSRTLRDAREWLYENRLHYVAWLPESGESYLLKFIKDDVVGIDTAEADGEQNGNIHLRMSGGWLTVTGNFHELRSIELYDIRGMKQRTTALQHQGQTVNISSLPSGVYFVRVNTDQGTCHAKMLKK